VSVIFAYFSEFGIKYGAHCAAPVGASNFKAISHLVCDKSLGRGKRSSQSTSPAFSFFKAANSVWYSNIRPDK
jgi:hypothetical protein